MFSYSDVLKDKEIKNYYNKIDEINNFYFSHGYKHAKNVFKTCKIFSKLLDLSKEDKNNLLISALLHDISCKDGRKDHPRRSAEFARIYLKNKLHNENIEKIADIISTHSDKNCSGLLNNLLFFADKIDISRKRLEKNYKEKYKISTLSEKLKDVKIKKKGNKIFVYYKVCDHLKLHEYLTEYPDFLNFSSSIKNKLIDALNMQVIMMFEHIYL